MDIVVFSSYDYDSLEHNYPLKVTSHKSKARSTAMAGLFL